MKRVKIVYRMAVPFFHNLKGWTTIRFITSGMTVVNSMLAAYIIQTVSDTALLNQGNYLYTLNLFVITLISTILTNYLMNYSTGKLNADIGYNMQHYMMNHLQSITCSEKKKWEAGEYVSRFTDDLNNIRGYVANTLPQIFYFACLLTGSFLYMASINLKLFLLTTGGLVIFTIGSIRLGKPMEKYVARLNTLNDGLNKTAIESIESVYVTKLFNIEPILLEKYDNNLKGSLNEQVNVIRRQTLLSGFNNLLYIVPTMGGIAYGGFQAIKGVISPGQAIAFIHIMHFFALNAIEDLLGQVGSFRTVINSVERVDMLLNKPSEYNEVKSSLPVNTSAPLLQINNLFYSYDLHPVLRGVDLELVANKKIALVGSSGSGKSTLINLICGFSVPQAGDIKLLGHSMREWNLDEARKKIALVSQDSYMFPGSIFDNILYGNPAATKEEVYRAAELSNSHEFIEKMPNQYETVIEERGANLSGGQVQRISIARAFLKNAPILLLDEPTSALDPISQKLVQQGIDVLMENRTVFIVAHRLETIRFTDLIYVMDHGQIVEKGTHEQLMERGAIYRKLYAFNEAAS